MEADMETLLDLAEHSMFLRKIKLLIAETSVELMAETNDVDVLNGAFDCLQQKISTEIIALLVLASPDVKAAIEEIGSDDIGVICEQIPNALIKGYMKVLLLQAAPLLKARRTGSY